MFINEAVFPKGFFIIPSTRSYLTRNVNNFFAESLFVQGLYNDVKKKKPLRKSKRLFYF
jgi:hypothetical protein